MTVCPLCGSELELAHANDLVLAMCNNVSCDISERFRRIEVWAAIAERVNALEAEKTALSREVEALEASGRTWRFERNEAEKRAHAAEEAREQALDSAFGANEIAEGATRRAEEAEARIAELEGVSDGGGVVEHGPNECGGECPHSGGNCPSKPYISIPTDDVSPCLCRHPDCLANAVAEEGVIGDQTTDGANRKDRS